MNPIIDTAYGRHCIEDDDIESVVKVLKSDYLSGGPVLEEFESEFAKKLGGKLIVDPNLLGEVSIFLEARGLWGDFGNYNDSSFLKQELN